MTIRSCDKCAAIISQKYPFRIGISVFYKVELRKTRAEPLIAFLNNNDMLQDKLREYGFITDAAQAASECESITR